MERTGEHLPDAVTRLCSAEARTCTLGASAGILAAGTVMELVIHRPANEIIVYSSIRRHVCKWLRICRKLKAAKKKQKKNRSNKQKNKKIIIQLKTNNQKMNCTHKYYIQTRSSAHARRLDIQRRQK